MDINRWNCDCSRCTKDREVIAMAKDWAEECAERWDNRCNPDSTTHTISVRGGIECAIREALEKAAEVCGEHRKRDATEYGRLAAQSITYAIYKLGAIRALGAKADEHGFICDSLYAHRNGHSNCVCDVCEKPMRECTGVK